MNAPDVTVLTVVHNGKPFLPACVSSVGAQAGVIWEHLVIDNGSTDGGGAWLEEAQTSDPRLRVIRLPKNLGCGGALRLAGPMVRGRYVAFLDADDLMNTGRLARQVDWLDQHPAHVALYADAEAIATDGRRLGERVFSAGSEDALRKFAEFSMPACHSTGMVRREDLEVVAAPAQFDLAQDYDALCRLLDRGRVGFLPEVVSFYRRHPAQVSTAREIRLACEGAAGGLLAARRRYGCDEHAEEMKPWVDDLAKATSSVGAVHAAFAARAAREGFARLELYHARRAFRRGHFRSLGRVASALAASGPHRGSVRDRWILAGAGPLRLCGVRRA